jgi:hypothetical protein
LFQSSGQTGGEKKTEVVKIKNLKANNITYAKKKTLRTTLKQTLLGVFPIKMNTSKRPYTECQVNRIYYAKNCKYRGNN